MNAKQVLAIVAIAFAGNAAMAVEAVQDDVAPVSSLSRAEVKATAVRGQQEATVFADTPVLARDRADVKAEARAAARHTKFDELQAG